MADELMSTQVCVCFYDTRWKYKESYSEVSDL